MKLPKTTPRGRVRVVLTLDTSAETSAAEPVPASEDAVSRRLNHQFPTIAELKAEAARKAAEREAYFKATGKDPIKELLDSMDGTAFAGVDGVEYQRAMRDEWPV